MGVITVKTSPMFRKRYALIALALVTLGLLEFSNLGHAESIGFWNKPCKKAYANWKKHSGHKAFVISGDAYVQGGQACGWVFNAASKAAAEQSALAACKKNRHGGSTCRVMSSQ